MKDLKPGYYWVKRCGAWEIALKWNCKCEHWLVGGVDDFLISEMFDEIGDYIEPPKKYVEDN